MRSYTSSVPETEQNVIAGADLKACEDLVRRTEAEGARDLVGVLRVKKRSKHKKASSRTRLSQLIGKEDGTELEILAIESEDGKLRLDLKTPCPGGGILRLGNMHDWGEHNWRFTFEAVSISDDGW